MLAGLSTGHQIGLAVVGGIFIAFALAVSFLVPRRWPDFPGRHGLSVFLIASLALFAAMITAVAIFGREKAEGSPGAAQGGEKATTINVTESEYKLGLPPLKKLAEGKYTFVVTNKGKLPHNLAISGGKASGPTHTSLIKPGGTAKLVTSLAVGNYTLYCSVPGHRQLGMVAKISVG